MTTDKEYRTYTVVPYDSAWSEKYRVEEKRLRPILGSAAVNVEHVGSTSVPGLAGKPTIDILVTTNDFSAIDTFSPQLERIGYEALGPVVAAESRLFVKDVGSTRLVNLHVFPVGHSQVVEMRMLRDYLRTHPEAVETYGQLKQQLARDHPNDYVAYRRAKDAYMEAVLFPKASDDARVVTP